MEAIRNFSEESNIMYWTCSISKITEGIEEEISETRRKAVQKKQRKQKIVDSNQDSMASSNNENRKRKKNKGNNSEEEDIVSNSKEEETVKKCSLMKRMIQNWTGIFQISQSQLCLSYVHN